MTKHLSLFFYFLFLLKATTSAQPITASASEFRVYEKVQSKPIGDALICISGIEKRTNKNGICSIEIPPGKYRLVIIHPRYDTLTTEITVHNNIVKHFFLERRKSQLQEVKISASNSMHSLSASPNTLSQKDINKLPSFLGQQDPLKAIQTLPGSGKGGDGNAGMYIRGGTSGQNLTLLNDAAIYNPSHLLGLFSVFNSSAVSNIKLHKSGIPAEFGGRASSLIEVNSSRKIEDTLSFKADISAIAANASAIMPINKNWSVALSGRKTFMNYSVWPVLEKLKLGSSIFGNMKYDFFDLNFNSNARLSKNNYLFLSAYTGGDDFGFSLARFGVGNYMNWKNTAISAIWRTVINGRTELNTSGSYSQYNFNFGMEQDQYAAKLFSAIKDYNFKTQIQFHLHKNIVKTGLQYVNHYFKPNTPYAKSGETELDFGEPQTYYSDESSAFMSDEFNFSEKLGGYAGLRLTHYRHRGPYTIVSDIDESNKSTLTGTISSDTYLEPSLTLRYLLKRDASIKVSYSKNIQPTHLISVTAINFPADFWMPSLKGMPLEKAHQLSAGYFKNYQSNKYECYVDLYYKKMQGLTEFSSGLMNLLDNLKIEEDLYFGSGESFGAEFFAKKNAGKFTGWLGYTISKNNRFFPDLNHGKTFPAKYDRRHDFSATAAFKLNSKWNFSCFFTYASGNAYTRPVSRYLIAESIVNEYGSFNGARMPAYHRADIAATYLLKSTKRTERSLAFSIYNVYGRQNPIYMFFLAEGDVTKYKVSVQPKPVTLLPILPSVTYKHSFK